MNEYLFPIIGISIVVILIAMLATMPGFVASDRKHKQARAVRYMGYVGVFFWPLYIAALIWAICGESES